VDWLALDAGIEEGGTGDKFWPSGASGNGYDECAKDEQDGGETRFGKDEHDTLWPESCMGTA
jgi:hypothetical protein